MEIYCKYNGETDMINRNSDGGDMVGVLAFISITIGYENNQGNEKKNGYEILINQLTIQYSTFSQL
jgi:hypothetical protein